MGKSRAEKKTEESRKETLERARSLAERADKTREVAFETIFKTSRRDTINYLSEAAKLYHHAAEEFAKGGYDNGAGRTREAEGGLLVKIFNGTKDDSVLKQAEEAFDEAYSFYIKSYEHHMKKGDAQAARLRLDNAKRCSEKLTTITKSSGEKTAKVIEVKEREFKREIEKPTFQIRSKMILFLEAIISTVVAVISFLINVLTIPGLEVISEVIVFWFPRIFTFSLVLLAVWFIVKYILSPLGDPQLRYYLKSPRFSKALSVSRHEIEITAFSYAVAIVIIFPALSVLRTNLLGELS